MLNESGAHPAGSAVLLDEMQDDEVRERSESKACDDAKDPDE